jgi:prophage maintenance system killer protein
MPSTTTNFANMAGCPEFETRTCLNQRWRGRNTNGNTPEETDLALLAAAYGFGLVNNHPYRDGNKRVGLLAMVTFLGIKCIDEWAALVVGGDAIEMSLCDGMRRSSS